MAVTASLLLLPLLCCLLAVGINAGDPPLKFSIPTSSINKGDNRHSLIMSMVVTDYGELLMADYHRKKVLLASLRQPNTLLAALPVTGTPMSLLLLPDGRVMLSFFDTAKLLILSTDGTQLTVNATLTTSRVYLGLAHGPDGHVLAATRKGAGTNARVDLLDLQGKLVKTVVQDTKDEFPTILYIRRYGNTVLIADFPGQVVSTVRVANMATGSVTTTFAGVDLSTLGIMTGREMDFDPIGNLYFGVADSNKCSVPCVLQISPEGQVTPLTWAKAVENHGHAFPYGLVTTRTQLIIGWWYWNAQVTSYQLPF